MIADQLDQVIDKARNGEEVDVDHLEEIRNRARELATAEKEKPIEQQLADQQPKDLLAKQREQQDAEREAASDMRVYRATGSLTIETYLSSEEVEAALEQCIQSLETAGAPWSLRGDAEVPAHVSIVASTVEEVK